MTKTERQDAQALTHLQAAATTRQRRPFHVDPNDLRRDRPALGDKTYHMRIAGDGQWYHEGAPIRRVAMVKLFASVLRRGGDGSFWLVTPAERGLIEVEDAPFVAVTVEATGDGPRGHLRFTTNIDQVVDAGPDHPIRVVGGDGDQPRPYLRVGPGLDALIARSVFYELVDRAVPRAGPHGPVLGLWSGGAFFELGAPGL